MEESKYSWDEISNIAAGTILEDGYENDLRYLIVRGPSSLCAYIGIPKDHPLANFDYDGIPIECHGGLTFGEMGDGDMRPDNYFWYGWDYAHYGDFSFYDTRCGYVKDGKKWLLEDVRKEIWSVTYEFNKLRKLAENIAQKAQKAAAGQ